VARISPAVGCHHRLDQCYPVTPGINRSALVARRSPPLAGPLHHLATL